MKKLYRRSAVSIKGATPFLFVFLSFCLGLGSAQAQNYYVFYNGTYGYITNGTNVTASTAFTPAAVWTASGTLGSTNRTLSSYTNSSQKLVGANNNVTTGTTSSNWRMSNNYLCWRSGTSNRYVKYSGSAFSTATTNSGNRFSPYTVTINFQTEQSTAPTISGDAVIEHTGTNTSFAKTNAAYTRGYIDYSFNNSHHYFELDNSTTINSAPTADGFTYAWSITGDGLSGHVTIGTSNGEITYSSYVTSDVTATVTLTATNTRDANHSFTASRQVTIKAAPINPTGISATSPMTVYVGQTGQIAYTLTPSPCYDNVGYQSASTSIATVNGSGVVTGVAVGQTTITLTAGLINGTAGPTATVTVNVRDKVATPVISFSGTGITATCSITCATSPSTIRYTVNGGAEQTYTAPFAVNTHDVVRACATSAISGYDPSDTAEQTYAIESGTDGTTVTLNDMEDHHWSYYLPNGGMPNNYTYPDKLCSPYPRNVKITYYGNGLMYTGADGGPTTTATGVQVSRYETENTFVYYKTLERDANNRFPYELIPNPFSKRPTCSSDAVTQWRGFYKWRVKSITGCTLYNASTGGTAQAVGALLDAESTYYFQPADNSYSNANNALSMQVELEAVWARAYRVACAVTAISTNLSSATFAGDSYERNFLVVNSGTSSTTTINNASQQKVTVTMVEPDGSSDYRASTRYINPLEITANNDLKFEFVNINAQVGDALTGNYWEMKGASSTMIYANMHNFIMGRGVDNTTAGGIVAYQVVGYSTSAKTASRNTTGGAFSYHMRVESGNYHFLTPTQNWTFTYYPGLMNIKATYGCDYDRAKGDNDKMKVRRRVYGGNGTGFTSSENRNHETIVHVMKSGNLGSDLPVGNGDLQTSGNTDFNGSVYFGVVGYHSYNYDSSYPSYTGIRSFYMEGGIVGNLNGGCDTLTGISATDEAVRIRMRGGTVRGALYGAATQSQGKGFRRFILTGGTVQGWIAGGADGTAVDFGQTNGASYIYVGGSTQATSGGSTTVINRAVGGNVFGAGCGYDASSNSGQMLQGSNVVIADNAYVERGVYGGGSYGYCSTDKTANIFILGGTVDAQPGGVDGTSYDASIQGGVYGGACQNKGGSANIYMTGGVVNGGIYGGSNASGILSGNTAIYVDGGHVGSSSSSANIHGGGLGASTVVGGNVDVTLGASGAAAGTGVVVYGDVYGGSALGKVNGTAATTTYHTNVTMNAGTVHGDIYGGGLGDGSNAANVYGPVTVNIHGGEAERVFGCNNTNGSPQQNTNHVNMDGGQTGYLYGGGNAAPYTGTPYVHMTGGTVAHHVFGGGLGANAVITGSTNVTLGGSAHVVKNVYGGGNAAQVTGNTYVKIE